MVHDMQFKSVCLRAHVGVTENGCEVYWWEGGGEVDDRKAIIKYMNEQVLSQRVYPTRYDVDHCQQHNHRHDRAHCKVPNRLWGDAYEWMTLGGALVVLLVSRKAHKRLRIAIWADTFHGTALFCR